MRRLILSVLVAALITSARAAELIPIVEGGTGYLIGAKAGSKWLKSLPAGKALPAGTKFRVFSLTRQVGIATGGKPKADQEVCEDVSVVPLTPTPADDTLSIAAPWNPLPRVPRIADPTQEVYRTAVRDFLRTRGLSDPKVKIAQILRIDLDGDGEDEVLLTATNYGAPAEEVPTASPANSYSIVLLRRVIKGQVRTDLLAGETYPKAGDFNAPSRYQVTGLLDIDGDGQMEVIVNSSYYEGGATTIYRCPATGAPKELLTVACGV